MTSRPKPSWKWRSDVDNLKTAAFVTYVIHSPTRGTLTNQGKWSDEVDVSNMTRYPTFTFEAGELRLAQVKASAADAKLMQCNAAAGMVDATPTDLNNHGIRIHV